MPGFSPAPDSSAAPSIDPDTAPPHRARLPHHTGPEAAPDMKTLFVRNIHPETREKDLRELFSRHGTVRDLKLPMDIFTRRCKGIAMIDMEGHEARAAQAGLDGQVFNGQALQVREEKPKGKRGRR
jgi:RNA recognition motif-containing protein